MIISKKIVILISLTFLLSISSNYQAITSNPHIDLKTQSNQNVNQISGNVSIIIYNSEGYYTDNQLLEINNTVSNLALQFSSCKFNITVIDNSLSLSDQINGIIKANNPQYLLIMGGVSVNQSNYTNILKNWTHGDNYTSIKEIGVIDYMMSADNFPVKAYINGSSPDYLLNNSVTFANVDFLQAGFMAGVKASLFTKTNKIGLIIDHSLQSSFYTPLGPSVDSSNNALYSFNRADFVNGFIAGVYYSSEHLLNSTNIEVKTITNDYTQQITADQFMQNDVNSLHDFGADVIFNMESYEDNVFIQDAKAFSIHTGVLGDNNSEADFSLAENSGQIISDFLNMWNSSNINYDLTYNLKNSTVLSLYPTNNAKLNLVQTLVLNGTIQINTSIPIQGVPGFEYYFTFIPLLLVIIRKKLKNHN